MAKIFELSPIAWDLWLKSRPEGIRKLCERFPPDRLYRMRSTGQRVTLVSYSEDDTLRVLVSGQYNFVSFEREVFGIKPEDLEECDLPAENALVGAVLTEDVDVEAFIDEIRPLMLAARDS